MKRKLFYVTAIVSLTLFAACSKDDGDGFNITSSKSVELTSQKTSQTECSDSNATYASEDGSVILDPVKGCEGDHQVELLIKTEVPGVSLYETEVWVALGRELFYCEPDHLP